MRSLALVLADAQEAQGQEGYAYLLHQQQRRRGAAYG
jgi:hypothetical protein